LFAGPTLVAGFEREAAGGLMTLALMTGLTAGATLALALSGLVTA